MRNILTRNIIRHFTALLILIFSSLSYSCIIKCLSTAPTHSMRNFSISSNAYSLNETYIQYLYVEFVHQFSVKCLLKDGFAFVNLLVTIDLLLAFCGNQVVSCFGGIAEKVAHCHFVTSFLPCWSISLSSARPFQTGLLGNQNLRVSDGGADVV